MPLNKETKPNQTKPSLQLVVGSKTSIYSQVVQHNKSPSNKYETIVKTLIQLEPDDWESFINKIKASSDTTRASDA